MSEAEIRTGLVSALESCRFALHCEMLRAQADPNANAEALEVIGEALEASQAALRTACAPAPPKPICSGCSPIEGIEDAREVRRWREAQRLRAGTLGDG